jgi:hypothetical protein
MKKDFAKEPVFWLIMALTLCVISMVGASMVQTSGGRVRVENLRIVAQEGVVVNGQVYIPREASPDNPLPLIVCQHGSFNNFQMQDLNMVELSRRGFIVISSDAYRHGSSSISAKNGFGNMIAVVDYALSSMNFVDKNRIGVTGHSMGGAIALQTVNNYLRLEALGKGKNPISAILEVGYDPANELKVSGVANPVKYKVNWGIIAAKYDEWFFRSPDVGNNPAKYLESEKARQFVNQLEGVDLKGSIESGKIYSGTMDGQSLIRVIYQNPEIHPKNHFSMLAAAEASTFFYKVFGVPSGYAYIDPSNQTWVWKEFFNCLGLVGILLFLFPFAAVIMKNVPYFSGLKCSAPTPCAAALKSAKSKAAYWIVYLINLVIPGLLVIPVMFIWIGKSSFTPGTVNSWFGEGNTTELGIWSAIVGVSMLGVFLLSFWLLGNKEGEPTECWGYKTSLKNLWKSFVLALLTVTVAYVILFFADLCFNTDFRVWMIAMRTFNVQKVLYAIAYFPFFAIFYLINSLLVDGGNRIEGRAPWKVTMLSCFANIAGIAVLIFIQYYGIVTKGAFAYNSMRIVNLFPLMVLIPIATIITQRYFKETGKIYLGAFTVAMLYTMMTVSNTSASASILK